MTFYTFANATSAIPLANLDANFATPITLGNTAVTINGTFTNIGNLTLNNANIASVSSTFPNSYLSNTSVTIGNTAVTLGGTQTTFGNVVLQNANVTSVAATFPNSYLANSTTTIGNTTVTLGSTTSTIGNLTLTNAALGTPASGNLTNTTADGTNSVGFLTIPQDAQTGNYTLVLADTGKHIFHASGAAAATYTIPANGTVAFATGAAVTFINMSANAVSIAITTDTMYLSPAGTTGTRTLAQYGVATAVKMTSTSWLISGLGLT